MPAKNLPKISNSQAECVLDCAKMWAFKYLDGIPEKPSEALEHGKKVHAQIEKVLKGKKEAKFSHEIYAQELIDDLLPEKSYIEKKIKREHEGVILEGICDALIERPSGKILIDWKTKAKAPADDMEEKVYSQLHLYGFLLDFEPGSKLVASYPEWKKSIVEPYSPAQGQKSAEKLISAHEKREKIKLVAIDASDVKGQPSWKCNYCSFRDICPDKKGKI